MAASKLAIVSLFFALILTAVRVDASIQGEDALSIGLDQLKSNIHSLESLIDERTRELKSKDEIIAQKGKAIQEKSDSIVSLQKELLSIQVHGAWLPPQLAVHLLQCQSFIETHWNQHGKPAMDVVIQKALEKKSQAGKWAQHNMETIKTKWIPVVMEQWFVFTTNVEERVQSLKTKTIEAYEASKAAVIPHIIEAQESIETHWNQHGKPAMDVVIQKALEKKAQAGKLAEHHMEKIKTKKWIPAAKEKWLVFTINVEPRIQSLKKKTIEAYEASKTAVTPHFIKVQEVVDSYFQDTIVAKPHLDDVQMALKRYTEKIVHAYVKFLKSAAAYHHQLQASALLALPIIILFRIGSALFCKKAKPARHSHHHSGHKGHGRPYIVRSRPKEKKNYVRNK